VLRDRGDPRPDGDHNIGVRDRAAGEQVSQWTCSWAVGSLSITSIRAGVTIVLDGDEQTETTPTGLSSSKM